MINMLVLVPTMVVVILGPEFRSWPLRLQVMVMGISPFETTQVNCANSPASTTSLPKEKGTILGGSKRKQSLRKKTYMRSSAFLFNQ